MKKTISAVALMASSTSAFALMAPPTQTKTICLDVYENEDGVKYAGTCDQAKNNQILGATILENGCAEDQIALTSRKYQGGSWDISIRACMPPNVVQL